MMPSDVLELALAAASLAQAGTDAAAAATPVAPEKSLLEYIHGGGYIGYVIILLSVAAGAISILNLIRLRLGRMAPPEIIDALRRLVRDNQVARAAEFCRAPENDCVLTRVFGAALQRCQRSPFGMLEIRAALEESGKTEFDRIMRTTDGIAVIAAVAPMLGLLGTVVGMVEAFDIIAQTEGLAKPYQLAGSISLALITTVQGLVVAIPCTGVHSYFRARVERLAGDLAQITEDLALSLEAGGDPRQAQRPQPAPQPRPAPEPVR